MLDKIGDIRSEISKKDELLDIIIQSFNNVLKSIGVDKNIIILHTTDASSLKSKLNDIETEVQGISSKENRRNSIDRESVKKEKSILNDNLENLKEDKVELIKNYKNDNIPLKRDETQFKRPEGKKQTTRKDETGLNYKRDDSKANPSKNGVVKRPETSKDKSKSKSIDAPLKKDTAKKPIKK